MNNSSHSSYCEKALAELDAAGKIEEAVRLCELNSCAKIPICQRYLGWFYADKCQYWKSLDMYLLAAEHGDEVAKSECRSLVGIIEAEEGIEKVISTFQNRNYKKFIFCVEYLRNFFFSRGDVDSNLHWSLVLAERGDSNDILYVGTIYLSKGDYKSAENYFSSALKAGNMRAGHLLGDVYCVTNNGNLNVDYLEKCYKLSSDAGYILGRTRYLHLQRKRRRINFLFFSCKIFFIVMIFIYLKLIFPNDIRLSDLNSIKTAVRRKA